MPQGDVLGPIFHTRIGSTRKYSKTNWTKPDAPIHQFMLKPFEANSVVPNSEMHYDFGRILHDTPLLTTRLSATSGPSTNRSFYCDARRGLLQERSCWQVVDGAPGVKQVDKSTILYWDLLSPLTNAHMTFTNDECLATFHPWIRLVRRSLVTLAVQFILEMAFTVARSQHLIMLRDRMSESVHAATRNVDLLETTTQGTNSESLSVLLTQLYRFKVNVELLSSFAVLGHAIQRSSVSRRRLLNIASADVHLFIQVCTAVIAVAEPLFDWEVMPPKLTRFVCNSRSALDGSEPSAVSVAVGASWLRLLCVTHWHSIEVLIIRRCVCRNTCWQPLRCAGPADHDEALTSGHHVFYSKWRAVSWNSCCNSSSGCSNFVHSCAPDCVHDAEITIVVFESHSKRSSKSAKSMRETEFIRFSMCIASCAKMLSRLL